MSCPGRGAGSAARATKASLGRGSTRRPPSLLAPVEWGALGLPRSTTGAHRGSQGKVLGPKTLAGCRDVPLALPARLHPSGPALPLACPCVLVMHQVMPDSGLVLTCHTGVEWNPLHRSPRSQRHSSQALSQPRCPSADNGSRERGPCTQWRLPHHRRMEPRHLQGLEPPGQEGHAGPRGPGTSSDHLPPGKSAPIPSSRGRATGVCCFPSWTGTTDPSPPPPASSLLTASVRSHCWW